MKLSRWSVAELAGWVSAGFLSCLVITAVSAVFLRYVFKTPLMWAEELEVLFMLWLIMTGSIYAKRHNLMLRVDILYNLLPPSCKRGIDIFQESFFCVIFCIMGYYGYMLATQVAIKTMPMLGLSMYWLYLSLPVGAIGMLIVSVFQLYALFTAKEEA